MNSASYSFHKKFKLTILFVALIENAVLNHRSTRLNVKNSVLLGTIYL